VTLNEAAAGVPAVLDPLGDRICELLTLAARPPWHKQAACRGLDQSLWFPEPGRRGQNAAARAICEGCPVQAECREWAIEHGENDGIWGGLNVSDRMRIRHQRPGLNGRTRRDHVQAQDTWTFGGPPSQEKLSRTTSKNTPPDSWRWPSSGYASSATSDHSGAGGRRSRGDPVTSEVSVEAIGS
jgi:WhiB family redox-sensing transcriptional regulator